MLKLMFAGAVAAGATTAAFAQMADQTAPASDASAPVASTGMASDAPSWAGIYAGLHGGYGFDNGRKISNVGSTPNNAVALSSGIRTSELGQNRSGALGGGQLGYNFQRGKLIFGGEGDFSYMDSRGTSVYRGLGVTGVAAPGRRTLVKSQLDWMGSVRARAGYALSDQGFVYATGGYAFGKVKGRAEFDGDSDSTVNYAGSHKYTAQGWIGGLGGEFRPFNQGVWRKISFGAEATYYDLGKSSIYALQTGTQPGFYRLGVATRGYNGVVKINYHF
ncbi:outer membrane protein [Sphingomonas nostoxanthinifaciens]|uniref:outer membrane protein n=1 Tax=Sphingomonas nostoxanthinifaciens TaxID=2872652 RepID=UPI001CC1F7C1|nr:hypothetical protein [Sphingomonas nostoxanthinifaciens]UAK22827.1 hypothetical protein K8P63_10225 [Sphingomonas nostoxanthinifaciens]